MIRGSTPTHIFELPIDTSLIKQLRITYVQQQKIVLEKKEQDVTMSGRFIKSRLSQEETLTFDEHIPVKIQLKILTTGGDVLPSQIFVVSADQVLNEEILA